MNFSKISWISFLDFGDFQSCSPLNNASLPLILIPWHNSKDNPLPLNYVTAFMNSPLPVQHSAWFQTPLRTSLAWSRVHWGHDCIGTFRGRTSHWPWGSLIRRPAGGRCRQVSWPTCGGWTGCRWTRSGSIQSFLLRIRPGSNKINGTFFNDVNNGSNFVSTNPE